MKNYQKLKQIIQEANPEIMELRFGCEVECDGIGVWMQKANHYFFRVIESQSLFGSELIKAQKYCDFRPYNKLRLSCIGFQSKHSGWKENNKYPRDIEIYTSLFLKDNKYKTLLLSNVYKGEIKILGRPIRLTDVLLACKREIHKRYKGYALDEIVYELVYDMWNVKHDSLDWHIKHKPETVEFIEDLLIKKG